MGFSAGGMNWGSLVSQGIKDTAAAYQAYGTAKSTRSAYEYQSNMENINAQMMENSAQTELIKGNSDVARLTLQHGQLKGTQRVALAANGADLGYGSAAEVQYSSEILKDIDMDTLRNNAARAAWGYRTQSMNYKNKALMAKASAKSISPGMAAFTSLLDSAGNVASSWQSFKK